MTELPPPPRLVSERDKLFQSVYDQALSKRETMIDLYYLGAMKPEYPVLDHARAWQAAGWGLLVETQDSYGHRTVEFHLNDRGIRHGNELLEDALKHSRRAKFAKHFWPVTNSLATWIAALAALAAAYFSYLGLHN